MNRVRQELIRNELMNIIDEYPRELGLIMDELISLLNDSQLDKMQILIDKFDSLGEYLHNYEFTADDVQQCISNGTDYKECVDKLVESMNQS